MFVMLKLLKLFVRLLLLPFRLLRKVIGLVTNSSAVGSGSESTDFGVSSEPAGSSVTESAGETSVGDAATAASGATAAASSAETGSGLPEPSSRGAIPALKWGGSLLAERPELLAPAFGLGVVSLALSVGLVAGDVGEAAVAGLMLQSVLSIVVAGLVAVVAAGELRGSRYSLATAGQAVAADLATGLGIAVLFGLGSGAFVALAILVSPVFFLLLLPMLYVFLRLSFAIPAVFVDGSGLADALGRSWSRTSGKVVTLLGIAVATGALSLLQVVPLVGPLVAATVATPLWAAAVTSLYVAAAPVRPSVDGASTLADSEGDSKSPSSAEDEAVGTVADATSSPASDAAAVEAETAAPGGDRETTGAETTAEQGTDSGTENESESTTTDDTEGGGESAPTDSGTGTPEAGATGGPAEGSESTVEASEDELDAEDRFSDDEAERATELRDAAAAGDLSPGRVDDLVGLLDSDDPAVRLDAVVGLGELAAANGAVADDARRALRDCRLDPDGDVSRAASEAIAKIEATA